jgi:hypothetical protein
LFEGVVAVTPLAEDGVEGSVDAVGFVLDEETLTTVIVADLCDDH